MKSPYMNISKQIDSIAIRENSLHAHLNSHVLDNILQNQPLVASFSRADPAYKKVKIIGDL